jgi:lipid A 4'-phosphatase
LFVYLVLAAFAAFLRHGPFLGIDTKGWIFLALALLLGPGLVANAILKDHWGRARPREVIEFGGQATFSPAVIPQPDARRNGSFISGDGAFGFYLPAFAYVVPKRQSRRFLSGGIALGFVFGMTRIVMGAHFLSDVAFAALFMFAVAAALHAAMFGRRNTADLWREWIDIS